MRLAERITRRSQVQILPPLLTKALLSGAFCLLDRRDDTDFIPPFHPSRKTGSTKPPVFAARRCRHWRPVSACDSVPRLPRNSRASAAATRLELSRLVPRRTQ